MRRSLFFFMLLALVVGALSCAKKEDAAQQGSTVDSLLASNPTEQTSGNLTPQTDYQQPAQQEPPTPAPTTTRPKPSQSRPPTSTTSTPRPSPGVTVPAGTGVKVAVAAKITSETAQAGDTWTGTVQDAVIVGDRVVIPAGSQVTGVVTGAVPAERGSRAVLVLALKSVEVNGKSHALAAGTDSIIAGSTRARNLGAIAGGAAAGALIGKAVGGSGKGALIGGLIGGAAATGAVAKSKGYQAEVKEGAEMVFTVNDAVVMN
jgi:hypothetical protein